MIIRVIIAISAIAAALYGIIGIIRACKKLKGLSLSVDNKTTLSSTQSHTNPTRENETKTCQQPK